MNNDDFTCVIYKNDKIVFCSKDNGIKPLVEVIDKGIDVRRCCAHDKIVGKAAALLYSYMGVSKVYAQVLSRGGLLVLQKFGIAVSYDVLTDKIINRRGDDICPMEKTVANIDLPSDAVKALQRKLKNL